MAKPPFIKSVAELSRGAGVSILVYGASGAGKTTLATTTPDPAKTLVLSAEGGTLSIRQSGVDATEITSLDDVRVVLRYLKERPDAYDWVVLDSASEIAEVVLAEEIEKSKDPRKAYGAMATTMIPLLKAFRDLTANTLVICASKSFEDDGVLVVRPDLPGKQVANKIPYLFDEVFYLGVSRNEDGSSSRHILTDATEKYLAKDRSGALDRVEPANLEHIVNKIHATEEV